jgi:hypothetical protein
MSHQIDEARAELEVAQRAHELLRSALQATES